MNERLETLILNKMGEDPDREVCRFAGTQLTRKQFAGLVEACRASLTASGFGPGDRLATLLPNSPLMLALSVAVWQCRGTLIPMSPVIGPELITKSLELLDPFALIMPDEAPELDGLAAALAPLGNRLSRVSLAKPLPQLPHRQCAPGNEDFAVVFATSGTTGAPKAVPLTHGNVADNIKATCEHVFLEPDMDHRILNLLPNFHTFGFCLSGVLPLVMGYSQVLLPNFLPPTRTINTLYNEDITVIIAVPTLVAMLCDAIAHAKLPTPPKLRMLICGGAAVPERVYRLASKYLGVPAHEGYGLTECSPVVAAVRRPEEGKPGFIGPFLPRFEHQLRDTEGNLLGDEERQGVLWVRGPSVCHGYLGATEKDGKRFDNGWFNTGDVVCLVEGGMQIVDRANDIIIVSGFNVYPQEVENCLKNHPDVTEAAVVGCPNALSGEFVKAFVIPTPDSEVTERELINWCKERLAPYKAPRKIDLVDDVPRNALGKVLRRILRDRERQSARK